MGLEPLRDGLKVRERQLPRHGAQEGVLLAYRLQQHAGGIGAQDRDRDPEEAGAGPDIENPERSRPEPCGERKAVGQMAVDDPSAALRAPVRLTRAFQGSSKPR